jgi:3'-5' exonuclease
MLTKKPLNKILFLDIETTSYFKEFSQLNEHQKKIFKKRFKKNIDDEYKKDETSIIGEMKEEDIEKFENDKINKCCDIVYKNVAGLSPEWGRILCISVGVLLKVEGSYNIKVISFYNDDESVLLNEFVNHEKLSKILNGVPNKFEKNTDKFWGLCAHNGNVFDYPYIAKRLIINGINLPAMFDFTHLKPWERDHLIDTMEEWTMGSWGIDKNINLDILAEIFNVESSKDGGVDGSQVRDVYYDENGLDRIVKYCERDVVALATVYLRIKCIKDKVNIV